ncbi:MAG: ATPase [Paracoccaceae bacterium]|nr:ATPase [Paracoccaceae bacterium]
MSYKSADDWRKSRHKRVLLLGMSGLGKTHVSNMLRAQGDWFHYSVDYRIGTRYMGELIADNAKHEAMKVPFLREMLMSDSIYIASNITFENLAPLSAYLGKPGDPELGGLSIDEYRRRQDQHRAAEISALLDTPHFMDRAQAIYGYDHFVCDTGGSICEVVDPSNKNDEVLNTLSNDLLIVWIEGSDAHAAELARRFDLAPKPMYYQPEFLEAAWAEYLNNNKVSEGEVDPDDFVRWTYSRALAHRAPLYREIAQWGVAVQAHDIAQVKSAGAFESLIASALEMRG